MMAADKRAYSSAKRQELASTNRELILSAAARLLNEGANISMEGVATAAGLTRLTVYNQFGSRRGLLEAVFDEHARKGGIKDLAEAAAMPDPLAALDRMIDILCRFWGDNPVIAALQDAATGDAELSQALESRQSRRREVIDTLLAKMQGRKVRREEAGDLLYALVSLSMFRSLASGRTPQEVAGLMKLTCHATLQAEGLVAESRESPGKSA